MGENPVVHVKPDEIGLAMVETFSRLWAKNAQFAPGVVMKTESTLATLRDIAREGFCIRRGTGVAGVTFSPFPWNYDYTIAYVVYWFFEAPRDMKVFEDACRLSKKMGATAINVASHFPSNRIGRYYASIGFAAHETQWCCNTDSLIFL